MRLDFVRVRDQTLHLRVPLEILDNAPRAFCRYFHGYGFTPARMSSALERGHESQSPLTLSPTPPGRALEDAPPVRLADVPRTVCTLQYPSTMVPGYSGMMVHGIRVLEYLERVPCFHVHQTAIR